MIISREYNTELIDIIDVVRKKLYNHITDNDIQLVKISFLIPATEEFLNKYKLNTDFKFIANLTDWNEVEVDIHYKDIKIKPEGFYLIPDNWVEPHLLDIFQECIKQDTHTPDIKKLETFDIKRDRKHKLNKINK